MRTKSLVWMYCVSVFMVMLFPGFPGSEGNASEEKNYQGLWVGEVILDQGSKLSSNEPEKEMEQTADTISMRVILHVDTENKTYLLSHVVVVALEGGNSNASEEKLFTDEEKLSKVLNDNSIARRIETVSYDLPRKEPPPEPLPENFDPKKLKEDYELAHLLDGELAPDATVKTRRDDKDASIFVIDQWHRSNPFRHTYHDQHTEGYRIVRDIQFEFDEKCSEAKEPQANYGVEVLTGKYQEEIKGLVKNKVIIAGKFILHRISSVGKLNE